MTIAKYLALAAFAVALPAAVLAQDGEVKFWLNAAPNNIQGCIAADPQFTREHTFTLKSGQAEVSMPGNIHVKLKLGQPNIYAGDFVLGRLNLHMIADLAATPKTLTVTEKSLGCKWSAIKQ
ncbi:MAG: hypothetical protein EPO55_13355 [Reyranella sp.]|uniref:hypothetical protein n=1 Tax=Reyranella sp. TaxID=1929291 RepID=UPI0012016147|nr:hypothetical protein [Reyranella sp.]TAJ39100.1 MAG: hypothetical protein EPO55_13355 [Reyranella sp.]